MTKNINIKGCCGLDDMSHWKKNHSKNNRERKKKNVYNMQTYLNVLNF